MKKNLRRAFCEAYAKMRETKGNKTKIGNKVDVISFDLCAIARNVCFSTEHVPQSIRSGASPLPFSSPLTRARKLLEDHLGILKRDSMAKKFAPYRDYSNIVVAVADDSDYIPDRRHVMHAMDRYKKVTSEELGQAIAARLVHPECMDRLTPDMAADVREWFQSLHERNEAFRKDDVDIVDNLMELDECLEVAQSRPDDRYPFVYDADRLHKRDEAPYTTRDKDTLMALTVRSPVNWKRMWSSGIGKRKAFGLLMDAIREMFKTEYALRNATIVSWHLEDEPRVYPKRDAENDDVKDIISSLKDCNFGEGDCRVVEAIRKLLLRKPITCNVQTIDTDMLSQLMLLALPHDGTELYLTLGGEIVDIHRFNYRVPAMFGDPSVRDLINPRRLCTVFFMFCYGTDYSASLTNFGFPEAELVNRMHMYMDDTVPDFVFARMIMDKDEDGSYHRCVEINMFDLLNSLQRIKRTYIKSKKMIKADDECAKFLYYISCIIYTVTYFAGVNPRYVAKGVDVRTCLYDKNSMVIKGVNIGGGPSLEAIFKAMVTIYDGHDTVSSILCANERKYIRVWKRLCTVKPI